MPRDTGFNRELTGEELLNFIQSSQSFRLLGFAGSANKPTSLYISINPDSEKADTKHFIELRHNSYSDNMEIYWFGENETPEQPTAEEDNPRSA